MKILSADFGLWQVSTLWLRAWLSKLDRIAQHQGFVVALIGALGFGGSVIVSFCIGIPEPRVHDEFSYLLAADTFAHGRLANPSHPLWQHFESFHIITQPTYASKYPPMQGLVLALGQVVSGYPIVGVWISIGLMCAAICWMLQAWLPPSWAMLGGALLVLRLGAITYWGQSYWGGAVAACGGALVFGTLRRMFNEPRAVYAILMGLGLAILANSRPYEGFVASLPVGIALLVWMMSKYGPKASISIRKIVLPLLSVLVLTAIAMGVYNRQVTGHPLRLPYQVYDAAYSITPIFLWQHPKPEPVYRHKVLRDMHTKWEFKFYSKQRSLKGYFTEKRRRFRDVWMFYFGYILTIPLVMLPWLLRDAWTLFALLTLGVFGLGLLQETWLHPHYAAPITGLVYAVVLQGMVVWQRVNRSMGQLVVWSICLISAVSFAMTLVWPVDGETVTAWSFRRQGVAHWSLQRAHIQSQLERSEGDHLIIVRYGPEHSPQSEWVYNEADIDGAKVIWARDMGADRNRALVTYFKDRHIWLLEINADNTTPELIPYSSQLRE